MTERTPLSPAAQAVMVAGTMGNPNVINDPVYRQCIAAALRAVAEQLGESRAPGLEPEELYGRIIDVDDLLAIADELEGADPGADEKD